ncbi:DNA-directed RNA polymerase subunit [Mycena sanguinolenta]|uniref:DNA-directed RNA polymerase subunit n=1 Tax=Mycena sanguinolenta TaxID=230812 RepID=A0A8H6Z7N5_9AGAR|nr:DNA-directed RNA polymerase subunit [Mycena sanguinolenta]
MLGHQFAYSTAPVRKVKEVQFGILSPEEIKACSVAKIEYPEVMDETTHKPKIGGPMDPRMGTIDRNFKCQTCGEGMSECPGHFGHVELACHVFHPGFIFKVKKILECICLNCGKLKADISDPNFTNKILNVRDPKIRMAVVWAHCKTKMLCGPDLKDENGEAEGEPTKVRGGCGYVQPQIRKEALKLFTLHKRLKDGDDEMNLTQPQKLLLSPSEISTIFKKILDSDLQLLGLSEGHARPEWMILSVMPVPPPPVRPSVVVEGGTIRSEDDLTHKLVDIIKASANLRKRESDGAPAHVIAEYEQLLQFHVATYMDNDIAGIPQALQKSGRPVKSIRARLKGKEGRLRGNLMGKRVDFSARTVITGDPNLELDEVGVPRSIAMNLTYPERVAPYNISYLQDLVRNGPTVYPGARYVVRDTGERIDLRHAKGVGPFLQYGWIVERHLKDGEAYDLSSFVLFNRQPSLHKMSMMSHRVKVMPYSTFRLNLSVTPPYNADFDGDEMNMHVPQSEETRAELSQIAWIISPQANKPVMGIVQDTLCGIRKFSLRDTFLDWNQVQNVLLWVPEWDGTVPTPAIMRPKPLWTGKQILSLVIPRGINITRYAEGTTNRFCPVSDDGMLIENGDIIFGIVDKKTAGASEGGLVHVVFREKGPEAARQLFTGLQRVVNFWLFHNGFSVGIGDTIADSATMAVITRKIADCKEKVVRIIDDATHDRLKAAPGMTIRESFEKMVERELNVARDDSGQYAQKNLKEDNNVKQMVVAGSKGSFINISQMSICVGQQIVEGRRIPFGFRHRTLPHFTKDDFSPEARGFVQNSYLSGLTPQEFFFHAMGGREGLIDTAIKTAETGYIQRRLVKALEDVMLCYDGTVRNSLGDVIQFVYGEDGMDGAFIEKQDVPTFACADSAFQHDYRVDVMDGENGFMAGVLEPKLYDSSLELQTKLDEEYAQLLEDRQLMRTFIFPRAEPNTSFYLPVNLLRIVQNARQIFHIDQRKPSDLDPAYIIDSVKELGEQLIVVPGDDPLSKQAQEDAILRFQIQVRATFACRRVLEKYHLTREAFDWVLGEVESKFDQAIAHPGEMCGTLAAQSIGEPATQMTLNTFHYAGVSSKNVTLGVPRLKEIINVATNLKTPSLTVYLDTEISVDVKRAQSVAHALEYTSLRTITSAVEIWYDPDPRETLIEEDVAFVGDFMAFTDEEVQSNLHLHSPWLLRLELNRTKMVGKLTMPYVASRIAESFKTDLFVIWSEDNSDKLVIRCRVLGGSEKADDGMGSFEEDVFLRQLENTMLNSVALCGVKDIHKVFLTQHNKVVVEDDGRINVREKEEWVLETEGVNLKTVMSIDGVDFKRTYSNSCVEIFNVLGIEAARAALLRELRGVIESDASYVNYRHLALLCDLMTHRGTLMPITRHGINRADTGALMRCSFEETVEVLMEAAAVGEKDDCHGIAENIMFGQMAPMGTGAFEVALDMSILKDTIIDHGGLLGESMLPTQSDNGRTAMTPYDTNSPIWQSSVFTVGQGSFSPFVVHGDHYGANVGTSPSGWAAYSPSSLALARYPLQSPFGGVKSPHQTSLTYSPTSPMILSSPDHRYSPTSPSFLATSPRYIPQSPLFNPISPRYSASSPSFSAISPRYSPSKSYFDNCLTSTNRSSCIVMFTASPELLPTSRFSPTSPMASPASPNYSPTSPTYSPAWYAAQREWLVTTNGSLNVAIVVLIRLPSSIELSGGTAKSLMEHSTILARNMTTLVDKLTPQLIFWTIETGMLSNKVLLARSLRALLVFSP